MPISQKELFDSMGLAYIPFTFPTAGVANQMDKSGVKTRFAEVDLLWQSYYQATTEKGFSPFGGAKGDPKKNTLILNYLAQDTNLGKMKAAAFLNALFEIGDTQYLSPMAKVKDQAGHYSSNPIESAKTLLSDIGLGAKNLITPVADPVVNILKYSAIALVAGAVVYGLWTFGPEIKKAIGIKKTRKRKG